MTIKRNGKEIRLTRAELYEAYFEQQHIFDVEDVAEILSEYENNDDEEIFEKEYGMTIEDVWDNMDAVANLKRSFVDGGLNWRDAVEHALRSVLK